MSSEWKVLIADDEPLARRGVRQLLAEYADFRVVSECRNGREVLAALDAHQPDVVFLDVHMPEMDGFEVIARRTPQHMPAVVFLTAFDQFAIRAFEAEAHDYLVKPVTPARFALSVQRLRRRLGASSQTDADPRIVVTGGGKSIIVPLRDIDWIEAADNYARLWVGNRSYLLRESLADLERRVAAHGFVRAHRRALVRLKAVRNLSTGDGHLIATLTGGRQIPVSRRRRSQFSAAVRAAGT